PLAPGGRPSLDFRSFLKITLDGVPQKTPGPPLASVPRSGAQRVLFAFGRSPRRGATGGRAHARLRGGPGGQARRPALPIHTGGGHCLLRQNSFGGVRVDTLSGRQGSSTARHIPEPE